MKAPKWKSAGSLMLAFVLTLSLIVTALAAPGELDPTFDTDGKVTTPFSMAGWVMTNIIKAYDMPVATFQQSDGKMIVASDTRFVSWGYAAFGLARYNADGSLDTTFDTDGKLSQDFGNEFSDVTPADAALLSDNRIVVVGKINVVIPLEGGGETLQTNQLIALFAEDGSLDTSFSTNGYDLPSPASSTNAEYTAVAVQSDNKIVVARYSVDSPSTFVLARYKTDGTLDTSFDTDGIVSTPCGATYSLCVIKDLAIQTVGGTPKIIALGSATSPADPGDFILMRYNLDGSLDTTFETSGIATTNFGTAGDTNDANALTIQADGKIIAVGSTNNGTNNDFAVARYTANGALDTSFDGDGKLVQSFLGEDIANSVVEQADGKILIFGCSDGREDDLAPEGCSPDSYSSTMMLVRYSSSGVPDTSFGKNGNGTFTYGHSVGNSVLIQPAGRIVGAGYGASTGPWILLVGLDNNGSLDNTFGLDFADTHAVANAVALQSDGKIVAAGYSTADKDSYVDIFSLARYNSDGSLDTTFDSDGRVITTFGDTVSEVTAVAIQSDGKIVAAGNCGDSGGNYKNVALARYNANGSLDTSFSTDGLVNASSGKTYANVYSMTIQSDGKIILAGRASNDGEDTIFMLTRYNANGTLDTTFGTGGVTFTPLTHSAEIAAIVLLPDGNIIAAGSIYYYIDPNPYADFVLARYSPNGILDTTFGTGGLVVTNTDGLERASAVALQANGKIIVAGTQYNASNDFILARYNADGSLDTSFGTDGMRVTDFNSGSDDSLYDVILQPNGKIFTAGSTYSSATGNGNWALAKYNSNGTLDTTFNTTGKLEVDINVSEFEVAHDLALQPDGQVILAGETMHVNNGNQYIEFALARVDNDMTPPTVASIERADATPTSAATAAFTVTFSEPVTGVDVADFKIANANNSLGASIASVTPVSATVYTVTVNTGQNGTLHLDVPSTATIMDVVGNALIQPYFSGESYMVSKGNAPTVPTLNTPLTNALVTNTPMLNWNDSSEVMALAVNPWSYEVNITAVGGYDKTFNTAGNADALTGLGDSSLTIQAADALPANTIFYWKVRAYNGQGLYSAWSLTRTFRTKLDAPVLNQPANDSTLNNKRPTFEWDAVDGAVTYTLQIFKKNTKTNLFALVNTGTIKAPAYTYTPKADLLPNTEYQWQVKANGLNAGNYSGRAAFTTSINPPKTPTLSLPKPGKMIPNTENATLAWLATQPVVNPNPLLAYPAAVSYDVQVSTNATFANISASNNVKLLNIAGVTTTLSDVLATGTAPDNVIRPGRAYYWRVRSISEAGNHSAWSAARTILVKFVSPTLVAPVDNAINVSRTAPTFTWSSGDNGLWTSYTIQLATTPPTAASFSVAKSFTVLAPRQTYTPTLTTATRLLGSKTYYWRVKINGLYIPTFSIPTGVDTWSFTTAP